MRLVVADRRIDRADLVARLSATQDELLGRVEQQKRPVLATVASFIGGALVLAYLIGRRAGRRRNGFIEIRR